METQQDNIPDQPIVEQNPTTEKKAKVVTNDDRLVLLKSRLEVAKQWAKKPHASWREWISEYNIDDVSDVSTIRDRVRIGYIFRKTESEIPAIFDDQPDLFIKGRTKDFQVIQDIYNSAYDLLWAKQDLESKIEDAGLYFELLGMGFISSPWLTKTKTVKELVPQPVIDPNTLQPAIQANGLPVVQTKTVSYDVPEYDMPDATVEDPFKLYFSPETKFHYVLDAEHCPHYFKKMVWSKEKVKARFGVDVEASEKMFTEDSNVDTQIASEVDKNSPHVSGDLKRVTVYEYYGSLPEDMAKDITSSDWEYDKDYHIFFTKNEELLVEECPYVVKPLFVVGNYGLANEFWKFGDAKHLKPLVRELELYRSQILQHTRKMANPKPLIEMNSEVDEQAFDDPRVGKPVKYAGTPPAYLSPANLGREVQTGVDMVRTDLEKTAGSFDLENGGSSSQVKTPRGIQVFSEAADKGTRRKRKKIARFIKQLIIFQFNQLALNWKPEDNNMLDIQGTEEPVTADVLKVLGDTTLLDKVDIEIESLSINRVQMKQDSLDLLDTALKSEAQRPGILNLELIWRDVLQNGFNKRDADRYILPEEQQQQIMQMSYKPKVMVRVNADSDTPAGVQLLENENLISPQQAQGDIVTQEITQLQAGAQAAMPPGGGNPQDPNQQPQSGQPQQPAPQEGGGGFLSNLMSMAQSAIFQPPPPIQPGQPPEQPPQQVTNPPQLPGQGGVH